MGRPRGPKKRDDENDEENAQSNGQQNGREGGRTRRSHGRGQQVMANPTLDNPLHQGGSVAQLGTRLQMVFAMGPRLSFFQMTLAIQILLQQMMFPQMSFHHAFLIFAHTQHDLPWPALAPLINQQPNLPENIHHQQMLYMEMLPHILSFQVMPRVILPPFQYRNPQMQSRQSRRVSFRHVLSQHPPFQGAIYYRSSDSHGFLFNGTGQSSNHARLVNGAHESFAHHARPGHRRPNGFRNFQSASGNAGVHFYPHFARPSYHSHQAPVQRPSQRHHTSDHQSQPHLAHHVRQPLAGTPPNGHRHTHFREQHIQRDNSSTRGTSQNQNASQHPRYSQQQRSQPVERLVQFEEYSPTQNTHRTSTQDYSRQGYQQGHVYYTPQFSYAQVYRPHGHMYVVQNPHTCPYHAYQGTSPSHSYQQTNPNHVYQQTNSNQVYQQTNSNQVYQETNPNHVYQRTNPNHVYQQTNSNHVYQQTNSNHVYQQTNPNHMYQQTSPSHLYQQTNPNQVYQQTNSNQVYQPTNSNHVYQETNPNHAHHETNPNHAHQETNPNHVHQETNPNHVHQETNPNHVHQETNPYHWYQVTNPNQVYQGLNSYQMYQGQNPYHGYQENNPHHVYQGMNPYQVYQGMNSYQMYQGMNPYQVYQGINPYQVYQGMNPYQVYQETNSNHAYQEANPNHACQGANTNHAYPQTNRSNQVHHLGSNREAGSYHRQEHFQGQRGQETFSYTGINRSPSTTEIQCTMRAPTAHVAEPHRSYIHYSGMEESTSNPQVPISYEVPHHTTPSGLSGQTETRLSSRVNYSNSSFPRVHVHSTASHQHSNSPYPQGSDNFPYLAQVPHATANSNMLPNQAYHGMPQSFQNTGIQESYTDQDLPSVAQAIRGEHWNQNLSGFSLNPSSQMMQQIFVSNASPPHATPVAHSYQDTPQVHLNQGNRMHPTSGEQHSMGPAVQNMYVSPDSIQHHGSPDHEEVQGQSRTSQDPWS